MRNHLDESSVAQSLDAIRLTGSLRFPGTIDITPAAPGCNPPTLPADKTT